MSITRLLTIFTMVLFLTSCSQPTVTITPTANTGGVPKTETGATAYPAGEDAAQAPTAAVTAYPVPVENSPAPATPTAVAGTAPGAVTPAERIGADNAVSLVSAVLELPEQPERMLWPHPGVIREAPEADLLLVTGPTLHPVILLPDQINPASLGSPIGLPLNGGNLLAFAPDASSLLVHYAGESSGQNTLALVTPSGEQRYTLDLASPYGASYSPDSKYLAVTSADEMAADVFEVATGKQMAHLTGFETAAPVYSAIISPGGHTLVWFSRATVQYQDVTSGEMGNKLNFQDFVSAPVFSPDGSRLAITYATRLEIYSVPEGEMLAQTTLSQPLNALAFSPDGLLIAAGYGPGIQIWEAGNLTPLANFPGPNNFTGLVSFSPDGLFLTAVHENNQLTIWRTR